MKLAFSTNAYLKFSFAEAVRRLAAIGYRGVEIMADVPHAWPAFMLPEQKQAIRDALAANQLAISNINAFMMHAVNDPPAAILAPVLDRAGPALSADPHRPHETRADAGQANWVRRCITTEPGGPVEPGRILGRRPETVRRDAQAGRRPRGEGGRAAAGRAGAGAVDRDGRAVPGIHATLDSPAVGLNFDIGHMYCVGDDPAASPCDWPSTSAMSIWKTSPPVGCISIWSRGRCDRFRGDAPGHSRNRLYRLGDNRTVSLRR